jgi:hypothetical protein
MPIRLTTALVFIILATGCGSARHVAKPGATDTVSPAQFVVSATLGPATNPQGYGIPTDSQWLSVVVRGANPAEVVAGEWEGQLIAQGDRVAATQSGRAPVEGVTFSWQHSDGSIETLNGGPFESSGPAQLPSEPSQPDLDTAIRTGLSKLGLTLTSLAFEKHGQVGPAPLVMAGVTGDAKTFVTNHPFLAGELGTGEAPIFVELVDASGAPVEAVGMVPMSSATYSWHPPAWGCFTHACPARPG